MNLQHATMTAAAALAMLAGCGGMSSDPSSMGASAGPGMSTSSPAGVSMSSPPGMGGQSGSSSSSSSLAQMQDLAAEQAVRLARQSSESTEPFAVVDGDGVLTDDGDDGNPVAIDAP